MEFGMTGSYKQALWLPSDNCTFPFGKVIRIREVLQPFEKISNSS